MEPNNVDKMLNMKLYLFVKIQEYYIATKPLPCMGHKGFIYLFTNTLIRQHNKLIAAVCLEWCCPFLGVSKELHFISYVVLIVID